MNTFLSSRRELASAMSIAVAVFVLAGCEQTPPAQSEDPALVSEADHEHDHAHVHSGELDHDHEHDDFDGSHAHDHAHPHRHDADGTELISIGHTHHAKGVTDYHARIDSFDGDSLTLTLLASSDGGTLSPVTNGPVSFESIIGSDRNAGLAARKATFDAVPDAAGHYTAALDELGLGKAETVLVLVPAIEFGGERLDFSFPLPKAEGTDEAAE